MKKEQNKNKTQVRLNSAALLSTAIIVGNTLVGPALTFTNAEDPTVAQPSISETAPEQEKTNDMLENIDIPEMNQENEAANIETPEVINETPENDVVAGAEDLVTPPTENKTETPKTKATETIAKDDKVATGKVIVNSTDEEGRIISTYTITEPDEHGMFNAIVPGVILGYIVNAGSPADKEHVYMLPDGSWVWRDVMPEETTVINFNYVVDEAQAEIVYMDDTTGEQVFSTEIQGVINTQPDFDNQAKINEFIGKGYELVSNGVPANPLETNLEKRVYTVHLKHGMEEKQINSRVLRVVNFMKNEKPLKTVEQEHTFTRTDVRDKVTNETKVGAWSDNNEWTFPEVQPETIYGYTYENGKAPEIKVNADSQFSEVHINYSPNEETAKVIVRDETTGTILDEKELKGDFDTTSDFNAKSEIAKYTDKGYELVQNDIPENGIEFNFDGYTREFVITLKHGIDVKTENREVTRTVDFKFADGDKAADSVKQAVNFTREIKTDKVTGEKTIGDWTLKTRAATGSFDEVKVPAIKGFTPDKEVIEGVDAVTPDTKSETIGVTFTANDEEAKVNFVDTVTGKTVTSDHYSGKFGEKIEFTQDTLNKLKEKGYTVIDNPTTGSIIYDEDGTVKTITVKLGHEVTETTETHDVNRVFNLVNRDTNEVIRTIKQTVTFKKVTTTDKVTGEVTVSDWKADQKGFAEIKFPEIEGMEKPDVASFPFEEVTVDSPDQEYDVMYDVAKTPITPEKPETEKPEVNKPGTETPETEKPGVNTPNDSSDLTKDEIKEIEKTPGTKVEEKHDTKSDSKTDDNDPQTGVAASSYGLIGAIMTGMSGLLGAAGFKLRKRK